MTSIWQFLKGWWLNFMEETKPRDPDILFGSNYQGEEDRDDEDFRS